MCVWVDETKVLYMNFYTLNGFTSEEACYYFILFCLSTQLIYMNNLRNCFR